MELVEPMLGQDDNSKETEIGPSGVHALPLAAGRNQGGHYFRYIFLLSYSCWGYRYSKHQKGL